MVPLSHRCTISGKLSGALITGLPNFIPFAFAAAIPSACRFRIFSRSFCATKDSKRQHLKHNICKEGAHQIFTPPRIEQRHIYDRNIHFFLSRQIVPLTLYILVITSKTVDAEDLYPSVFYNNLNIQKKDDRWAPAIKQVPNAVSRTKLQNDWLSDADELQ